MGIRIKKEILGYKIIIKKIGSGINNIIMKGIAGKIIRGRE